MFEGFGSYIRERDEDRVPTVLELEDRDARSVFIAERALQLLGTAKLAAAIQDDMTGFFGHEPKAVAMMLSHAVKTGDWKPITDRVNEIAKDVAAREWGRP